LERLASHPLVDISEVLSSPANRRPQAVSLDYHKPVWSWASQEDQQEWQGLEAWRPGKVVNPISRSRDKQVSGRVFFTHGECGHQAYLCITQLLMG
jgi:hypothetical protein